MTVALYASRFEVSRLADCVLSPDVTADGVESFVREVADHAAYGAARIGRYWNATAEEYGESLAPELAMRDRSDRRLSTSSGRACWPDDNRLYACLATAHAFPVLADWCAQCQRRAVGGGPR